MKLIHKYYDVEELCKRWSENEVTEKDILKWGANKELQFSILLEPSRTTAHIDIEQYHLENSIPKSCGTKRISFQKREFFDIHPLNISDILYSPKKDNILNILPWCKGCDEFTSPCVDSYTRTQYVVNPEFDDYNVRENRNLDDFLIRCTKDKLVIKLDEVLRFENSHFKQEEATPPYLDPANEFYSVTLDLAVRTWKAIFIDKKNLDAISAKEAGKKYLKSPDSYCAELFKKYSSELTDTLALEIGKIAAGEYSFNKRKWNIFRQKK